MQNNVNGTTKKFNAFGNTALLKFDNTPYAGAEVRVKLDPPLGLTLEIQAIAEDRPTAEVFTRFGDEILESWNLVDDSDADIPATGEGMMRCSAPLAIRIVRQWVDLVQGVPENLEKPSIEIDTFPVESIPMVISSPNPES